MTLPDSEPPRPSRQSVRDRVRVTRLWLLAREDGTFAFLHRVEHRWRRQPPAAYHGATTFDRRVFRTLIVAVSCVIALLFVSDHATRTRWLLLLLIVLFVTFLILSLLEAFPRGSSRRPNRRN